MLHSNKVDKSFFCSDEFQTNMSEENPENPTSVYDFMVKDTYDNDIPLDKYKGKVLLIVNIASRCGHTKKNYTELTALSKQYENKGVFVCVFQIHYNHDVHFEFSFQIFKFYHSHVISLAVKCHKKMVMI